jgi:uncharacterized membrane protein YbaN (DUF454 family)
MNFIKLLYISLGTISLGIAILGIIVPGLPATPFLLITAALYMRGSKKMHDWLMQHRLLGPHIRNFKQNRSVSAGIKIYATLTMWLMVFVSCKYFLTQPLIEIAVIVSAAIGSIVLIFFIKTTPRVPHANGLPQKKQP